MTQQQSRPVHPIITPFASSFRLPCCCHPCPHPLSSSGLVLLPQPPPRLPRHHPRLSQRSPSAALGCARCFARARARRVPAGSRQQQEGSDGDGSGAGRGRCVQCKATGVSRGGLAQDLSPEQNPAQGISAWVGAPLAPQAPTHTLLPQAPTHTLPPQAPTHIAGCSRPPGGLVKRSLARACCALSRRVLLRPGGGMRCSGGAVDWCSSAQRCGPHAHACSLAFVR